MDLTGFSLGSIVKKLKEINPAIQLSHAKPFPKEKARWLSCYHFVPQYPEVADDGSVRGGLSQLPASLLDFSFLRSIAADAYSIFGGPCYDPISLFLLDLFRYLDAVKNIKDLCRILHDPQRGKIYRRSAGLSDDWLPCQATFTNFRRRLGETRYQEIFHTLVTLIEKLGLPTYRILSTDGTLFPTRARYRGCTYFCDQCAKIQIDNVADKVRDRRPRKNHHRQTLPRAYRLSRYSLSPRRRASPNRYPYLYPRRRR